MAMKKSMKRSATPKASKSKKAAAPMKKEAPTKMKRKSSTSGDAELSKETAVKKLTAKLGKSGVYVTAVLAVLVVLFLWFAAFLDAKMVASKLPAGAIKETYLSVATSVNDGLHTAATTATEGATALIAKLGLDQYGAVSSAPGTAAPTKPAAAAPKEGGAPPQVPK